MPEKPKWVVYKASGGWAWRFEGEQIPAPVIYETRTSARLAAKRAAQAEYDARLQGRPLP